MRNDESARSHAPNTMSGHRSYYNREETRVLSTSSVVLSTDQTGKRTVYKYVTIKVY